VSDRLVHLVDDDDAVRRSLARLLTFSGYQVREYVSGTELLEASEGLTGTCILLDLNMPGADGFTTNEALKDRSIGIPVVLMTGGSDVAAKASSAGIAAVIQKPFRRQALVSVLDKVSAQSEAATEL
jgi:two-component system response regulator FixJ